MKLGKMRKMDLPASSFSPQYGRLATFPVDIDLFIDNLCYFGSLSVSLMPVLLCMVASFWYAALLS